MVEVRRDNINSVPRIKINSSTNLLDLFLWLQHGQEDKLVYICACSFIHTLFSEIIQELGRVFYGGNVRVPGGSFKAFHSILWDLITADVRYISLPWGAVSLMSVTSQWSVLRGLNSSFIAICSNVIYKEPRQQRVKENKWGLSWTSFPLFRFLEDKCFRFQSVVPSSSLGTLQSAHKNRYCWANPR